MPASARRYAITEPPKPEPTMTASKCSLCSGSLLLSCGWRRCQRDGIRDQAHRRCALRKEPGGLRRRVGTEPPRNRPVHAVGVDGESPVFGDVQPDEVLVPLQVLRG